MSPSSSPRHRASKGPRGILSRLLTVPTLAEWRPRWGPPCAARRRGRGRGQRLVAKAVPAPASLQGLSLAVTTDGSHAGARTATPYEEAAAAIRWS